MFFPSLRNDAEQKEYYANMLKRMRLIQKAIINFDDEILESEPIAALDKKLFSSYRSKIFGGRESVEIKAIKAYENTVTMLEEGLNINPKELTVLEFYQKLEYIEEKNKKIKKQNS